MNNEHVRIELCGPTGDILKDLTLFDLVEGYVSAARGDICNLKDWDLPYVPAFIRVKALDSAIVFDVEAPPE